ncbi:hypothetical protein HC864_03105 [Candidatus Gracilibacteria bacterium]|nr:hypothetical protein [Candidatus Gracilibacteria bacterium]
MGYNNDIQSRREEMAQFNESKSEFDSMVLGKDKANIKKTLSELEVSFDDSLRLEIEIPKKIEERFALLW